MSLESEHSQEAAAKPKSQRRAIAIRAGKKVAFSNLTNGRLLPKVDLRSTWVRRLKDLIRLYQSDKGGADQCSEASSQSSAAPPRSPSSGSGSSG
jgi:hypothetical protein